ncbi:MAG: tRNA threonylcarbamoyladenosine dehydratase [Firmicutes bacterium]|nr:tRNA threonylcarbamoyladenosine dehydratase [Bacillota bacterium]NLL88388.1 tRNA threonylcarbamoyladenosine dehydratase [Bacillota bacterium]
MERFIRTEWLIGRDKLCKLQQAAVAVFGLGGVGAAAVEGLARTGIGTLILVDHDKVSLSNLNRQLIALESTVGCLKVEVAAERVRDINPDCNVITYPVFYQKQHEAAIFAHKPDYVVDAIDSVAAKLDLIEGCYRAQIPIVSAMGAGNRLDPTRFQVADISKTHTCPLAKVIRAELRKRGIETGIKTVFSDEPALKVHKSEDGRNPPGSIAFVPPAAGYVLASVVVRDLLKHK